MLFRSDTLTILRILNYLVILYLGFRWSNSCSKLELLWNCLNCWGEGILINLLILFYIHQITHYNQVLIICADIICMKLLHIYRYISSIWIKEKSILRFTRFQRTRDRALVLFIMLELWSMIWLGCWRKIGTLYQMLCSVQWRVSSLYII